MSDDSIKKLIILAFVVLILYWGITSPESTDKEWLIFLGPILMTYLFKSSGSGGSKTKQKKAEEFDENSNSNKETETPPPSRSEVGVTRLHWSFLRRPNSVATG